MKPFWRQVLMQLAGIKVMAALYNEQKVDET
jgi:hypothetical protein